MWISALAAYTFAFVIIERAYFVIGLDIDLPYHRLGSIIALLANILIDKGFGEATELMKRSSDDTCRFLNDISAHINHLLGNNFEETVNHLTDMVNSKTQLILLIGPKILTTICSGTQSHFLGSGRYFRGQRSGRDGAHFR